MSDEETTTGVQLAECFSKNPLVSEEVLDEGMLRDSDNDDAKPSAVKKPPPPAPTPPKPQKKSTLRPESVRMAMALNLHQPGSRNKAMGPARKAKAKRGGGGQKKQTTSTRTSPPSPPPPRKVGGEDDDDNDDLKPPASKVPAPSPLKSPSLEDSGEDSIEDNTDVDKEELPDSEPVNNSTVVVESRPGTGPGPHPGPGPQTSSQK